VLEEETAQAFHLYTVWLYNGRIDRADEALKTWVPLSQAYVMGEKFIDAGFQAVILKAMIKLCRNGTVPDIKAMNAIYHGTNDPSPARRFMIDICLWGDRGLLQEVENPVAQLHEDFVRDLLKALMAQPMKLDAKPPWVQDAGDYLSSLASK
jgi:hypothetical protein